MVAPTCIVLGPQRLRPTVAQAVRDVGVAGPVAVVTAGWEEREDEDGELREHVGADAVNLRLYERVEDVFRRDPELLDAMRARHDTLRALQALYRLRLGFALEAARELLARQDASGLVEAERVSAIEAVRLLDAHHLERVRGVHAEFDERWRPRERSAVQRHRAELDALLAGTGALCVAGGHVAILLNRMRVFDLTELVGARPIVAWSAGAMALSERVVLFHDSPPQGPGDAEVLETGLGAFPGLVPLPHARRRLRLDDAPRVRLFAERFGPSACVALDEGARLDLRDGRWSTPQGTRRLTPDGALEEVGAP